MSWWRQNRFWLPALPVAIVALLLASSYQLKTFWYDEGLHHRIASGDQGDLVRASQEFEDAAGPTTRTFGVRLTGLSTAATFTYNAFEDPSEPPEGVEAVVANLDWEASPDQALRGCFVSLVDTEGRRYEIPAGTGQANVCVPDGREGPETPLTADQERGYVPEGADRPPTWSTAPVFLVPEGRRITQVLVSWGPPDYVRLSAS